MHEFRLPLPTGARSTYSTASAAGPMPLPAAAVPWCARVRATSAPRPEAAGLGVICVRSGRRRAAQVRAARTCRRDRFERLGRQLGPSREQWGAGSARAPTNALVMGPPALYCACTRLIRNRGIRRSSWGWGEGAPLPHHVEQESMESPHTTLKHSGHLEAVRQRGNVRGWRRTQDI